MLKQIQINANHISSGAHTEYSRILSAAVINAGFRSMLLNNPVNAVGSGYRGEHFQLGNEERNHLASIHAQNLSDFATQLVNM